MIYTNSLLNKFRIWIEMEVDQDNNPRIVSNPDPVTEFNNAVGR